MAEASEQRRLLILIARDESVLDEMVTGMLDSGLTGATVVESRGLGAILRQDMPMFAGFSSMLPQQTGSRVVIALTSDEPIARLREFLSEMPRDKQPIGIVVNAIDFFGLATTSGS